MTMKLTFFIGLNDKDEKVQIIDTLQASKTVERIFLKHGVEGATITGGRGIYRHVDTFEVVSEYTIIVQVFVFGEEPPVRAICNDLKEQLNQESIAVERRETDSQLY